MKDDASENVDGDDAVQPDDAEQGSPEQGELVHPPDMLDSTFQVAKRLSSEKQKQFERFPFRLNCPHCHEPIVVVDDGPEDNVVCSICGSNFHLDRDRSQSWSPEKLPTLGKFKLLEVVGRGAFGTVYRAQDTQLHRIVAVKVPRSGTFVTHEDTERFEREARHVATLNHPGIVPVFEVGQTGEFPFIVAEFVDGVTVGEVLGRGRIGTNEAAFLMADVADAVHHAHEHGIVHRDIKPSNVLLERRPADTQDDTGSGRNSGSHSGIRRTGIARQFRPRVMDFGLARHEAGEFTVTLEGQVLGTPAYMSPEQARGDSHEADRRSDVYSLGVMLYVMLTGELPFRGSVRMLIQQVLHDEPPSLRKLNQSIPRDLETICLKCLQKEPLRRYQTAAELREDLLRFVNHEPIMARPVGRLERLWRWTQRKPLVAGLTAAVAVSLIAGTIISSAFAVSASRNANVAEENAERAGRNEAQAITSANEAAQNAIKAQQNAEQAKAEQTRATALAKVAQEQAELAQSREFTARWSAYVPGMRQAFQDWSDGYTGKAIEELKKHIPAPDQNDLRGFEWGLLWKLTQGADLTLHGHRGAVRGVAVSVDGKLIASCGVDHTVRLWDTETGKLRVTLNAHTKAVHAVAFSPDGEYLASASDDETVRLWDTSTFQEKQTIYAGIDATGKEGPRCLTFSPDGKLLVVGILPALQGTHLYRKGLSGFQEWLSVSPGASCLHFQPESQAFLLGTSSSHVQKIDVETGKQIFDTTSPEFLYEHIRCLLSADDGQTLISHGTNRTLRTVNLVTGYERRFGPELNGWVHSMALSPTNDRILAIAGGTRGGIGRLELLDRRTGQRLARLHGHTAAVRSVSFLPDGQRLVTGSDDGTVRVWTMPAVDPQRGRTGHVQPVTSVAVSKDGLTTFTGSADGTVRVWNSMTGEQTGLLESGVPINDLHLSSDSQLLAIATGEPDSQVQLVDAATLETKEILRQQQSVSAVVLLKGDSQLAAAWERTVAVLDIRSGRTIFSVQPHSERIQALTVSQDGQWIASASDDRSVVLMDAETGRTVRRYRGHSYDVLDVEFSPDGMLLASASKDGTLRLWKTNSAESVATLYPYPGGTYSVNAVAFSPDGQSVVAGSDGIHGRGRIRAWNTSDFTAHLLVQTATHAVRSLVFSADGNALVSGNEDSTTTVWDFPGSLADREHEITKEAEVLSPHAPKTIRGNQEEVRKWIVNKMKSNVGLTFSTWGKRQARLGTRSDVWSVAWSPDGRRIACGEFARVRFLDPDSRDPIEPVVEHELPMHALAFSPDGSSFASADGELSGISSKGSFRRTVTLQSFSDSTESHREVLLNSATQIRSKTETNFRHSDFDAHNILWLGLDRFLILEASCMGRGGATDLQVWSAASHGYAESWLADQQEQYGSAAISPDRRLVAAGTSDYFRLRPGHISLLDAQTGRRMAKLQGHTMPVTGLVFLPDGKTLVSGSVDMTLRLWDVETASTQQVLEVTSPIGRLALHPDGSRLVLSCFDGTVRIWETQTWQEVATLPRTLDFELPAMHRENYGAERSGEINGLTFSPDGNTLLVGWGNRQGHGGLVYWDSLAHDQLPDHDSEAIRPETPTVADQDRQRLLDRNLAELDRHRDAGTIDSVLWYRGRTLLAAEEFTLDEFDLDCRRLFESALAGESAWGDLPGQLASVEPLGARQGRLYGRESPARIAQVRNQQRDELLRIARGRNLEDSIQAREALQLVNRVLRINPEDAESLQLREKIVALHPPQRFTSSLGIELIEIRPSQFNMGSPLPEQGRELDEFIHPVRISGPFLLGLHEVTHAQFAKFVAATEYQTQAEKTGSAFTVKDGTLQSVAGLTWKNPGFETSDDQPVVCVTRNDALEFCRWLSKQDNRQYSLPTEAQWEYACRAGTMQSRFWGDAFETGSDFCVSRQLTTDLTAPQPVGSRQPNPLGLFDMLGSVQELCLSRYGEYPSLFVENPIGPASGSRCCVRGGSWLSSPGELRAASRGFAPFDEARTDMGFRVVCRPE